MSLWNLTVRLYWHQDEKVFFGSIENLTRGGSATINYEDGDKERVIMDNKTWRFEDYFASSGVSSRQLYTFRSSRNIFVQGISYCALRMM